MNLLFSYTIFATLFFNTIYKSSNICDHISEKEGQDDKNIIIEEKYQMPLLFLKTLMVM